MRRRRKIPGFLGLLLASALAPTTLTDAQVPKTVTDPYVAPADQALLVFTRPRKRQASETEFRVVDQSGRCVSFLKNGWQTAAPVWPGKQMLLVIAGSAQPTVQLVQAKLSGGKTYVVRLRARVNVKSPVEIDIIRRSDQPLAAFPAALKEQSPFPQDPRACREWVSWKRSKIESKAEQAKRRWDDATEEYRAEHTIRRNDGWTAAEVQAP